jgi:pimeloyl-ACP methyl ester carboxylesterase
MKKTVVTLGRTLTILLLLAGLSVCTMSEGPAESPPGDAISFDQLLASLDELQESATQSPSAPGMSVFSLPNGSLLSSSDLSAYLNAVKRDLAAYIYSCTGGAPYLVTAKSVSWTTAEGDTESGLIWAPFTWSWRKRFPLISLQHGTQSFSECAPSRFNANPLAILSARDLTGALQNYVECIVGGLMATAGYLVAMPDYPGFGRSSAMHPYVHLTRLGKSVEGIVGLALSTCKANGNVYLTGYSEGGYATMAGAKALQSATGISPTIRAIVPCDGPYSLSGAMLTQMLTEDRVKVPSYLLYTASGYFAAEPGRMPVNFSDLLVAPWSGYVGPTGLFNGDHTNAEIGALIPAEKTTPRAMLTAAGMDDLDGSDGDTGPVHQLLVENDAWYDWIPRSPLVFVHCRGDDVVPYDNALKAQAAYGGLPEIVDVAAIPLVATVMGTTHIAAFPTAMLAAFRIIRGD